MWLILPDISSVSPKMTLGASQAASRCRAACPKRAQRSKHKSTNKRREAQKAPKKHKKGWARLRCGARTQPKGFASAEVTKCYPAKSGNN